MSDLVLRTAMGNYGHTTPLKDGTITSPAFSMEQIEVSPVTSIFRRMVRELEFEVAEMALSTYLCARAHGKQFTGVPIFLTRAFYHGGIVVNRKSGIESPKDLEGQAVRRAQLHADAGRVDSWACCRPGIRRGPGRGDVGAVGRRARGGVRRAGQRGVLAQQQPG